MFTQNDLNEVLHGHTLYSGEGDLFLINNSNEETVTEFDLNSGTFVVDAKQPDFDETMKGVGHTDYRIDVGEA